jgi:poly-gamma-glutamate synthesis protein (capsule biosynthesis protein)
VLLAICLLAVWGCRASQALQQQATGKAQDVKTLTLAAVGDVLLDRDVGKKIEQFGMDYPFQRVADVLSQADIAFGNLECPLSERGIKVVKPFVFQAKPERVKCLISAGLDIVSLANNHTMDCGRTGLVETMETLRQNHVRWCGAGRTRKEAEAATVIEAKGIKVAFVGFCDFVPEGAFLRDDKPTMAMASKESVRASVSAARQQADVVVASFHWGVEFRSRPTQRQTTLAHAAVNAGADVVLGHHPHVLQGFEVSTQNRKPDTRNALIAYSLGNFVFDQRRPVKETAETVILRCALSQRGVVSAEVVPIKIEECQPRPATKEEGNAILTRMSKLCGEMKTQMTEGRIQLP